MTSISQLNHIHYYVQSRYVGIFLFHFFRFIDGTQKVGVDIHRSIWRYREQELRFSPQEMKSDSRGSHRSADAPVRSLWTWESWDFFLQENKTRDCVCNGWTEQQDSKAYCPDKAQNSQYWLGSLWWCAVCLWCTCHGVTLSQRNDEISLTVIAQDRLHSAMESVSKIN